MLLDCPGNSTLWDWEVSWNTSWPDLTECCHQRLLTLAPMITAFLAWLLASGDSKRGGGRGSWRKFLRGKIALITLVAVQVRFGTVLYRYSTSKLI